MPTFGSMFAGIGGFELGLTRAGWNCVWANEWNKYACQIYRKHFGEKELCEGDIRDISSSKIPDFDLLVGGFPCQSFSLAGKRKGTEESRGTLFAQIVRVASAKRPKLLLLENVKGLLSSDNGRDFAKILRALGNLGYVLEWQVLNSKFFGVPQNRERVFIVGHHRGAGTRQVFPVGTVSGEFAASCREAQGEGQRVRVANPLGCGGSFKERNLIANTISQRYYKDGSENLVAILADNLGGNIKQRVKDAASNPAWILGGSKTLVAQALQTDGWLRSGNSFANDKPQSARNVRRLTPVECERLQGFPDGWTEGISDTQRYKCLGNAVTVNVIEYLGHLLLASLNGGIKMVKE